MDLFEARDFFESQNPGKKIEFEFDEKCHRFFEFVITDGSPNLTHHVECRKVKVTVDGKNPIYVPISPHRLNVLWCDLKDLITKKTDVFFHDKDLQALSESQNEELFQEYQKASGLTKQQIEDKVSSYKARLTNQDIHNS